jgi:Zn-finger nucleic acid-binding protein
MELLCPRDGTVLQPDKEHHVSCERCPTCRGDWFELDQFETLEVIEAGPSALPGTIEYATRDSDLKCPSCRKTLTTFNYRGYNLQLDACNEEHGFWLDAGEPGQVISIMRERVRGLGRASRSQAAWYSQRERGFQRSLAERLENLFRGR